MRLWNAVAKPFKNIHRIFPTQQIEVGKMIDVCKKIPNVKRIVIFGSSVTPQCNPWSDIDIYFELASEMQKLPVVNDTEAIWDKWDTFSVDDELLSTIMRTGVVVYER
ncbi:nucleotidyltransferase domain-containing protein [uncultured Anaerovibrio sp.]|uniref:nucleotidyltransferase domain-containing protein n=1 Tax=uncultured Anaerovibrio sp. TaxID=361586 RepID=UPI002615FD4C|nr:nucleotidyltransferase domain-containing protein [uncultured Anaerovibrio sp.]